MSRLPHKNTLGYWVRPNDWARWEFEVSKPGTFRVEALLGCGPAQRRQRSGVSLRRSVANLRRAGNGRISEVPALRARDLQRRQARPAHVGSPTVGKTGPCGDGSAASEAEARAIGRSREAAIALAPQGRNHVAWGREPQVPVSAQSREKPRKGRYPLSPRAGLGNILRDKIPRDSRPWLHAFVPAGLDTHFPKIIRPALVCSTLVTVTFTVSLSRSRPPSTTIIVPSSR